MATAQCALCRVAVPEWDLVEHRGRKVCNACFQLSAGPPAAAGAAAPKPGAIPRPGGIPRPGSVPRPGSMPRPGGGRHVGGFPTPPSRVGASSGGWLNSPGDLLVPIVVGAVIVTLLVMGLTGAKGVGGLLCVGLALAIAAVISGALLMGAAAILHVPNVRFADCFLAAAAVEFVEAMLFLDGGLLHAGPLATGAIWVFSRFTGITAVGRFLSLDWSKSVAVWAVWFAFQLVLAVILAVAMGSLIVSTFGPPR